MHASFKYGLSFEIDKHTIKTSTKLPVLKQRLAKKDTLNKQKTPLRTLRSNVRADIVAKAARNFGGQVTPNCVLIVDTVVTNETVILKLAATSFVMKWP